MSNRRKSACFLQILGKSISSRHRTAPKKFRPFRTQNKSFTEYNINLHNFLDINEFNQFCSFPSFRFCFHAYLWKWIPRRFVVQIKRQTKSASISLANQEILPNMMTAPHFFGNSYPVYHGTSIENLQARESPLDLQITNKQRNCEPPISPSPNNSPR